LPPFAKNYYTVILFVFAAQCYLQRDILSHAKPFVLLRLLVLFLPSVEFYLQLWTPTPHPAVKLQIFTPIDLTIVLHWDQLTVKCTAKTTVVRFVLFLLLGSRLCHEMKPKILWCWWRFLYPVILFTVLFLQHGVLHEVYQCIALSELLLQRDDVSF
jgi:hypothetical protein